MLTTVSNFGGNIVGWSVEQAGNAVSIIGTEVKYLSVMALIGSSIATAATLENDLGENAQRGFFKNPLWKFIDLPQLLSAGGVATGSFVEQLGVKVHALGSCLRDPQCSVSDTI